MKPRHSYTLIGRGMERGRRFRPTTMGAALLWSAIAVSPALGDEFFIADGDLDGLRAAITESNGNGEADTIHLAAGGQYLILSADNDTDGPNGLPVISSQIDIEGNGATLHRVSGSPELRIIMVSSSGDVTMRDIVVSGGRLSNAGGGIRIAGGSLTLERATVRENWVRDEGGGGIANIGGTLLLIDTSISDNEVGFRGFDGGGIWNEMGEVTAANCTISRNMTHRSGGGMMNHGGTVSIAGSVVSDNSTSDGGGGGVYARENAVLMISDSTVTRNHADSGAGIASTDASTEVIRCMVSDNVVGVGRFDGGGIVSSGGSLTVVDSTICGNRATRGGGIDCGYAEVIIRSCTICQNEAVYDGGGISKGYDTLALVNSTISGNSSQVGDGGGVYIRGGTTSIVNCTLAMNQVADGHGSNLRVYGVADRTDVTNCIIADAVGGTDTWGGYTDIGYNIVEDGSGVSQSSSRSGDPSLGPLMDNGGPSPTHMLLDGSIARDTGDCAGGTVDVDQRGISRPQGDGCDVGAVEAECVADFNRDGVTDTRDVIDFLSAWAGGDGSADLDQNGVIDTRDVLSFLGAWAAGC